MFLVFLFYNQFDPQVPLQLGKLAILNPKNGIWLRVVRRSQ
jgi:hypothetical protein